MPSWTISSNLLGLELSLCISLIAAILKDDSEIGYIIPYEGRQNKPYATGLAMDEVLRTCQLSNAKHMLFLVDACYGGLAALGSRGLEPSETPNYLEKISNFKIHYLTLPLSLSVDPII